MTQEEKLVRAKLDELQADLDAFLEWEGSG